jgi:dihydrolipoamide dehydrogenase
MRPTVQTRLLVVGGGPGGYVTAIRAAQLGVHTTLVEADCLGGTCLARGCIPSKALIHAASELEAMTLAAKGSRHGISLDSPPRLHFEQTRRWKDGIVGRLRGGIETLLERAGVHVVRGWATFSDAKTCVVEGAEDAISIHAESVVLATGSISVGLPSLPFGGKVISSTEALSLPELPKSLLVVGAGYIGLELGIAFAKLGVEVAIVEAQSSILPLYDEELVAPVRRSLDRLGIKVHTKASACAQTESRLRVRVHDGREIELPADKILVTVGRRALTEGWGLENMAVDMDGGFVRVDEQCRTSMSGVWAIGDLVGEPMLAHKASAQGECVAEIIAGRRRRFDVRNIPSVCFTDPEIVVAGLSPRAARSKGEEVIIGTFPFVANGRALSMGAESGGGFVRVVARAQDHRILGVQAVGAHVSELSGQFAQAIEMDAVLEDIAGVVHVHPTLSEAFHEAALKGLGHAIHI